MFSIRLSKAAHSAEKIISQISEKIGLVAVGLLLLIMIITVADVFLRYLFNRPISITMELTEFMMVVLAFFAISWCALKEKHVKVDLILNRFSQRVQNIFDVTNYLLVIFVSVLIGWRSLSASIITRQLGTTGDLTKIPHYPFYWVVTFGYFALILVTMVLMIHSVYKVIKR